MARDPELQPDTVLNRGGVTVSKSPWGARDEIGPLTGVPVLGLDALSSAAYGPEAALTLLLAILAREREREPQVLFRLGELATRICLLGKHDSLSGG